MGMPPSARPASASAMAAAMNSSMLSPGLAGRCAPDRPHPDEIATERQGKADEPGVVVDLNPEGRNFNRGHGCKETRHTRRDPRRQHEQGHRVEPGSIP